MTTIKICGMMRPADIEAVNASRPDQIGFVFAKGRRRCVSHREAAAMKAMLDPAIAAVGVFADNPLEEIAALVRRGVIDGVQLHGHETEAAIAALRAHVRCPIVQAFAVASAEDLRRAEASSAQMILLDNGRGGTGERFDWRWLQSVRRPFVLSGGLDAASLEAALALHPAGIDLSSGVETDGQKDPAKIAACVARFRALTKDLNDDRRKK
jgi:phosphoribosylanthranilate isomerase